MGLNRLGYEAALICTLSVFVNGRGRPEIVEDMSSRIARGDVKKERADAIKVQHPPLIP